MSEVFPENIGSFFQAWMGSIKVRNTHIIQVKPVTTCAESIPPKLNFPNPMEISAVVFLESYASL
jgi:hypothetical protein